MDHAQAGPSGFIETKPEAVGVVAIVGIEEGDPLAAGRANACIASCLRSAVDRMR